MKVICKTSLLMFFIGTFQLVTSLDGECEAAVGGFNQQFFESPKQLSISPADGPNPGQKSLMIVFDGTGSMSRDLEQLRSGANDIVNDLSSRANNPIYNYILTIFNDPSK